MSNGQMAGKPGQGAESGTVDHLHWCAEELRRLDPDRWMTALFAPEGATRDALFALYAFNLELGRIRSQVRELMLGQIRLQWWREAVEGALAGEPRPQPVAKALAQMRAGLSLADLNAMIDGREAEFDGTEPQDIEALETYSAATSGALMAAAARVLGASSDIAAHAAKHGGIAYALAGVLRSVPHYAARNQVWLPAQLLGLHGLTRDHLVQSKLDQRLLPVVREVAARAKAHLREARLAVRTLPKTCLPAFLPIRLAALYLDRLEAAGFDVESERLAVGVPRRQFSVLWASMIGRV